MGGYYNNVLDFGARPGSGQDDSDAFEKAFADGGSLYVPAGEYFISRTIYLKNQNLCGENSMKTILKMTDPSRDAAVIRASRSCVIRDLQFGFADGIVDGTEKAGERPGLVTGFGHSPLQRGSAVRNVRIESTGTAVYSAEENCNESFSVTYDTLEICHFSYRGFDFKAENRTGNVYSNIYMYSKYDVDTLFSLDTEESEVSIHQLNVEHTSCRYGIRLVGIRALAASSVHMEGLTIREPGGAFLFVENTSGAIESLSIYYSCIDHPGTCLVEIGDGVYDIKKDWAFYFPENLSYLRIGTLHLKGLNDPAHHLHGARENGLNDPSARDFLFFGRRNGAKGDFRVAVDNFVWYTFKQDEAVYRAFPVKGIIGFLSKGKLPAHGPSSGRPAERLCPFVTTYYDTDRGRLMIWDGNEWKDV